MSKNNFQSILKRGSYSSFGVLAARVATAFAGIIMARSVGPADFGLYAAFWALIRVTLAFSETGMTTGIKKDGARNPEALPELLGNTLLAKVCIGVVAFACVFYFYGVFAEADKAHSLILPLSLVAFLLLFVDPVFAVMQVNGKQKAVAALQTGKSFCLLAGFTALAVLKLSLLTFVWFQALLNCLFLVVIFLFFSPVAHVKWNFSNIGAQFYNSLVFGVSGILYTVTTQLPVLALAKFSSSEEVGYFAVAYRFIELIFVVGAAASNNAFLPSLFGLYKTNRQEFLMVCNRMQVFFLSLGIVAASSLYLCAEPLIVLLQGEAYRSAIELLHVMSWAVMMNMGVLAAGASLTAADKMRTKIMFQICVASVTVLACVFFIYPFGALGASYTICLMWGSLVGLYLPYAMHKGYVQLSGMFRFAMPSILTIIASIIAVHYSSFHLAVNILFFFLWVIIVWSLSLFQERRQTVGM